MPLNNYQKMCYRWFGRSAENVVTDKMKASLERAHITIRPGAYISFMWVSTIVAAIVSTVIYLTLIIFLSVDILIPFMLLIIPVLGTLITYLYFKSMPSSRAKARGKKIDLHPVYEIVTTSYFKSIFIPAMVKQKVTCTGTLCSSLLTVAIFQVQSF